MNYFQVLGVLFGLAAFLKPFYMHILPWDENKFISKAYAKERPRWVLIAAVLGIFLVLFTIYMEIVTSVSYSIVITVLFSLTAVKALILLFDYGKFQSFVSGLLSKDKGRGIVLIDVLVGVFGLFLILISLFLVG